MVKNIFKISDITTPHFILRFALTFVSNPIYTLMCEYFHVLARVTVKKSAFNQ